MNEILFRVGGAAGDGVASTAETFARLCVRGGLYVHTYSSYQSVIRGGHGWTQVRASEAPVLSHGEDPNLVICLNQETADIHASVVQEGGAILHDASMVKLDGLTLRKEVRKIPLPMNETARGLGEPMMKNVVALGAALALLEIPFAPLEGGIKETFGHKKPEIVEMNLKAAHVGFDALQGQPSLGLGTRFWKYPGRMMITGNEAICLGAMVAGCKFYAAYPMTPASSILHWMAANGPQRGVVVKQAEDELAVINMAIGAAHAGARAMCATSGGGFSLMVEALGEAGMTETPVVCVLVQRAGPSTGVPTKTEQGDLNLALGAGQGDWPRAILAPRNTIDCYDATVKAFNLAEAYQTPVILMSDLYLGEGYRTAEEDQFNLAVPIQRGLLASDDGNGKGYLRFKFTEDGISPRAFPGMKGYQFTAGTDEHMESGVLVSDVLAGIPEYIAVRRKMMDKRMRKLEGLRHDLSPPELWGAAGADLTIVSWGSTAMTVREAIIRMASKGYKVNALEFFDLYPFKAEETQDLLERVDTTLCVEGNYMGQFAHLLRAETGYKVDHMLTKYDGEPFEAREIVDRAIQVME
ncbi:MAG TPA: 2-oxoacid:acceptor oxidoreductase subunit alpha, partial [Thermoplasmata archaeon]|nr:2-oxoacid:acceptor oxidoreductase subunit alpha [Thermoplasmata archaeon]